MKTSRCHGQPSWKIGSDCVDVTISRLGGQIAPVRFQLPKGTVQPFSVAPWAEEKQSAKLIPLLRALRGDFFCLPFGGNGTPYRGEAHPPHGETANRPWDFVAVERDALETRLHLRMVTRTRLGTVDKFIGLRQGETALYCRHVVSGMQGKMSLGHHAVLQCPEEEWAAQLSMSPIHFAQVLPTAFENPVEGGYSALKPGAVFSDLRQCPMMNGSVTDLSHYPARKGFDDLAMVIHESRPELAWTAVTFPREGYAWFALKDPRVLRSTVLWMSNGGRHYAPWNGRHANVLGVEDVTSYFHYGLAESVQANSMSQRGFPTSLRLRRDKPLVVNYIMGVAAVPKRFDRVKSISAKEDHIVLRSSSGQSVSMPLHVKFLWERGSL